MRIWGKKHKKLFSSVLFLGIFLFSTLFSLVFPETSYAILGAGDTSIDVTPPGTPNQQQLFHVQEKVKLSTDKAITASVLSSAVQGASYFMRRLAYDTAVYVATGGKGQGSLLFSSNWDQYLGQVGGDALGRAVQELGSVWGLDFCKFPNLDLQLYLQIGLREMEAPTTECSWNDLVKAYGDKDFWNKGFWERQYDKLEALQNRFDSSDEVIKEFSKAIKVKNSDFGIALGAIGQVDKIKVKSEDAKTAERLEGAGFKPLTDALSGRVKTPGDAIGEETKAQLSASKQQELTYGQLGSIYASGAIEIIPQTASLFLNTLTNQLLQRLLTQGLVEDEDISDVYAYDSDSNYRNKLSQAKAAYTFLLVRPSFDQITNFDLVSEFAACPENPGLNNCVMDSGLQEAIAISRVNSGLDALTIWEAMVEKKYLDENWLLISPRNEREHQDIRGCVVGKYCYSNIQKLRKARILPLGFEIAALRSDPDNPWRLGDVVRGFHDCTYDEENPGQIIPDPAKPFCHLINPNWIIKAPQARCEANVISNNLISNESGERSTQCVDVKTCLQEDEKGACLGYGYCTKEKNVWKIGADVCPDYYNTCTTYTNVDSKKVVSYLSKTLDYGQCTADDVGCRAYSLENLFAPEGQAAAWKNSASVDVAQKASGRNQVVFFNEKIEDLSSVCSTNSDGCTAFYTADRASDGRYVDRVTTTPALEFQVNKQIEPAYIRKAPDYMGCYDTNLALLGNQWPLTIQEAQNSVSQNPACNNFAAACVAEEVGCEAFTPLKRTNLNETDGPSIPGKIGAANICASECLGYETFKQEESPFESAEFPVHFIPSQAKSCPAIAAGCSEFTNIDVQARGGEGLEYYTDLKYCEKPAGDNMKTFYSWEGSADNGYVLQTYRLKQLPETEAQDIARSGFEQGSPAYILDMPEFLDEYVAKCNEQAYNALLQNRGDNTEDLDCKAFFDDEGTTYYRLLSKTVSISPECHPLRKTEPEFVVDTHLATEQICVAKKGVWSDEECQRCKNGGKFENGFCVYNVITAEAQSCAAEYNGCRAYSGNAVGNIEQIFFDDFEPAGENPDAFVQAANGWKSGANNDAPLRIVGEATHTGLHSIEVTPGTIPHRAIPDGTISENSWYEVSFLAKSGQQNTSLLVQLKQYLNGDDEVVGEFTTNNDPLVIGNSWQVYRLGPVQFTGTPSSTFLTFSRTNGNSNYYIDQVQFKKLTDYAHYVKDSWKAANNGLNVPLACDSAPLDDLPGEALGCRAYADSNNNVRFATGFERLCREDAIGCAPVWDTYNTIAGDGSDRAQVFNLECQGAANATCRVVFQEQELGSCFVEPGATSCSVEKIVLPEEAPTVEALRNAGNSIQMTASSVFIPADTPDNAPIFLAVGEKNEFACSPGQKGCQSVGLEEKRLPTSDAAAFSYTELFVKNDPDSYLDTLCRDDLVGCAKFKADNQETYFKDPQITGNSLCVYKPQASNQSGPYGWFLKDIGRCSNDQNELCRADSDCGEGATCTEKETVACAEDNLRAGGFYDIWSNSTPDRYQGNVGVCTAEYNGCREIVDRQDTSNLHPEGKPYYVIFNQKMEQKAKECTQASLTEGCVLFDKTDEPNKIFDSEETYLRSQNRVDQPFGLVDPVRPENPADADTNLLLKVNRDRECSEWLSCQTYIPVVQNGKRDFLCYQYRACEGTADGENCNTRVSDLGSPEDTNRALNRLSYNQYTSRNTDWFGEDFSGYSLYNKFQITNMVYLGFNFSPDMAEDPDVKQQIEEDVVLKKLSDKSYIVRKIDEDLFFTEDGDDNSELSCDGERIDWKQCGFDLGGRCYNNRCIYPIDGVFQNTVSDLNNPLPDEMAKIVGELESNICKDHPETNSPFESAIATPVIRVSPPLNGTIYARYDQSNVSPDYANVNICQEGECSCAYEKVTYGAGQVDYWPISGSSFFSIPQGICSGANDGSPCVSNIQCVDRGPDHNSTEDDIFGVCNRKKETAQVYGKEGFCLEYDFSRPQKGSRPYQCLTWLPINVSVSRFDINNTYVEAGYDITQDASNGGGENYCVASNPGRVVTNAENLTFQYALTNTEPDAKFIGEEFYSAEGLVNFPGSEVCYVDTSVQTQIHANLCGIADTNFQCLSNVEGPLVDKDEIKQFIDIWARKKISPAANILRIEIPSRWGVQDDSCAKGHRGRFITYFDNTDRENFYTADGNCGIQAAGSNACSVYTFAPSYSGADDYGILMHPPRFLPEGSFTDSNGNGLFDGDDYLNRCYDERSNLLEECNASYKQYYYDQTDNSGKSRNLSTANFLPGGRYPVAGNRDPYKGGADLLFSTDVETNLIRDAVKGVYFVPTGFPYGAEGDNPALFSKELFLNFTELDDPGNNGVGRRVSVRLSAGDDARSQLFFPDLRDVNTVGTVYTFVQNSDLDYPDGQGILSGFANDERNIIDRRYILLFYGPRTQALFNGVAQPPVFNSQTTCEGQNLGNWFAVGMDFNADGEFLGYVSRWCAGADERFNGDNGIQFAVVAELNTQCIDVKKVYSTEGRHIIKDTTNKAWTNRIWQLDYHPVESYRGNHPFVPLKNEANKPFGSLLLSSDSVPEIDETFNLKYFFKYADRDGIPYRCGDNDAECSGIKAAGYSPQVRGLIQGKTIEQANSAIDELFAFTFLRARRSGLGGSIGTEYTIAEEDRDVDVATQNFVNGEPIFPPQIYSLDPFKCQDLAHCTAAEKDNITVGEVNGAFPLKDYNNDGVFDEDFSPADGRPDAIVARGGSYLAITKFFGFANDNRMPIRSVRIDWSDGSEITNDSVNGLYKNYKPLCSQNSVTGDPDVGLCSFKSINQLTGLTCSNNIECPSDQRCISPAELKAGAFGEDYTKSRFGNSSRACEQKYFEYVHEYTCDRSDVVAAKNGRPAEYMKQVFTLEGSVNRLKAFGLEDNDWVCVYRPRVQLTDNWGWCNGRCTKQYDDAGNPVVAAGGANMTEGCYDAWPTVIGTEDQCANPGLGIDPWTEYDGSIIVVPVSQ